MTAFAPTCICCNTRACAFPSADIKGAPASIRRLMDDIRTWFRMYKVPEGKGENEFAFDGAWQDRDTALAIVDSTHRQWRSLVQRSTEEQAAAARRTEFGEAPAIKGECGDPFYANVLAECCVSLCMLAVRLGHCKLSSKLISSLWIVRADGGLVDRFIAPVHSFALQRCSFSHLICHLQPAKVRRGCAHLSRLAPPTSTCWRASWPPSAPSSPSHPRRRCGLRHEQQLHSLRAP